MLYDLISLSYPFQLTTPPEAKKYFNFRYPPPGEERVFYGRANDPQIAPYLTHGIRSKISMPVNLSFSFLLIYIVLLIYQVRKLHKKRYK